MIDDDFTIDLPKDLLYPIEHPKFIIWSLGFGLPETQWVCDVAAPGALTERWELMMRVQAESPEAALKLCCDALAQR